MRRSDSRGPRIGYPTDRGIHELFEARAAATPDAVAVVDGDRQLAYQELNRRANRVAHHLRARGAGPETLVGICLERSIDMVVGLLGILKAGAAYVGLGPGYGADRVAFMIEDLAVRHVLTRGEPAAALPRQHAELLLVDELTADPVQGNLDANPARTVAAGNLAYAIYTSGSTGAPKAVGIEHGGAMSLLHWVRQAVPPSHLAGVLATTSPSFDCTLFEVFAPLSWGGTVVLASSVLDLATPSRPRAEVTLVSTVPSTMAELLRLDGLPRSVRAVHLAGDALPAGLVRRLYGSTAVERVVNLYGPSETTTYSSAAVLDRREWEQDPPEVPPIGRPVGNTRILVLDPELRCVPVGEPGEICIGGAGVARGYLNRPELTAERFVAHPLGDADERLYRTGDLGRYGPDGTLWFLGRIDRQVKIRGFRVEPGEVEAAIVEHPAVADAAVTAQRRGVGEPYLAAYVVPDSGPISIGELRAFLLAKLPEHMVPAAFVTMSDLPRTANGKVDRRALPAPERPGTAGEAAFAAPSTPTEAALTRAWADVLDLDQAEVGVHDDFFDLGGDSLLAARLLFRLGEILDVDLVLPDLLDHPTVARLADAMTARQRGELPAITTTAATRDRDLDLGAELGLGALPPPAQGRQAEVLLTGATGFFGAFLLDELLRQTGARVHCLVRAGGRAEAWERLRGNLERYGLRPLDVADRVQVLVGDLAQPRLGLGDDHWESLAERLDTIYQNGAHVDVLLPYAQLEAANVGGTLELLRLATTSWLKEFHLVSTISAGDAAHPDGTPVSGYAATKREAERIAAAARSLGVPASVYRLPRLSGDSRTGTGNPRDLALRVLTRILQVGAAPDLRFAEPWVPVDAAASLLVGTAVERRGDGLFALVPDGQVSLDEVLAAAREHGRDVSVEPMDQWEARLARFDGEREVLGSLLRMSAATRAPAATPAPAADDGFTPIAAPGVDRVTMRRYLDRILTPDPHR